MTNKIFGNRLLLFFIFILGFIVRLYGFNNPIADWHSWRQSDTSAVSRNFVNNGFDVFHPRFDDLSNVPSGLDNPDGYRFVEFPIYNIAQGGLLNLSSILTLEEWGRMVSIISSLFSALFLYLIVKKYKGKTAGFFSAFFYLFLPFNIYFNRTILPDSMMVMASLGGVYFFDKWINDVILSKAKNPISRSFSPSDFRMIIWFILSLLFTVSAFLLKPYALFFTLPMIYLVLKNFSFSFVKKWQIWTYLVFTLAPLIFWRFWMQQYPEGIPVSDWLFNAGNIRFKGAFFHWIFGDRIGKLILGYWGLPILIFGVLSLKSKKILKQALPAGRQVRDDNALFFLSFLASSLLYIFVIARGNVQHDYYQILIVPSIAIFLGIGTDFLINTSKEYFNKSFCYLIFMICVIFMLAFGWYFVKDFFNINNPSIVTAGKAVDRLTPKDAKVIAIYNGDTSFLYQTKRKGWASFEKDLPVMIDMGAEYLVLVNPTEKDYDFGKKYKIVSAAPEYLLFDLQN